MSGDDDQRTQGTVTVFLDNHMAHHQTIPPTRVSLMITSLSLMITSVQEPASKHPGVNGGGEGGSAERAQRNCLPHRRAWPWCSSSSCLRAGSRGSMVDRVRVCMRTYSSASNTSAQVLGCGPGSFATRVPIKSSSQRGGAGGGKQGGEPDPCTHPRDPSIRHRHHHRHRHRHPVNCKNTPSAWPQCAHSVVDSGPLVPRP
jgi:hypothetical protein